MEENDRIRSRGNYAHFTRHGYPIAVIAKSYQDEVTKATVNQITDANASQHDITESSTSRIPIYQPLPDGIIRVIDLLPGLATDPICVNLRPVPIESPGAYEALSYTWGSEVNQPRISVNGHSFEVTENLFAALVRFRNRTSTRTLWIDAIAINQSSVQERTQQVRLMTDIYNKADKVLAWLGESKNAPALDTLFNVAHERHDYAALKQWLGSPEGDHALLLFSQDSHCLQIVSAVRDEYDRRGLVSRTGNMAPPGWNMNTKDSPFMFIGYRQAPPSQDLSPGTIMTIMPDFDLNQVQKSALRSHSSFDEFLIDAARPASMDMSDEKMLEVFDGLNDLLDRSYWQRAWIVQEIIVSKECIVCFSDSEQEIDIEILGAVYGLDKRTGVDIKNFMLEDFYVLEATKNLAVLKRLHALRDSGAPPLPNLLPFSQLTYHRQSRQKATETRDKVFSLFGMLKLYHSSPTELGWCQRIIDYSSDTRNVYIHAAQYLAESYRQRSRNDPNLHSNHILDNYHRTRDEGANTERLPGWVPNFASETDQSIVFNTGRTFETDILMPYNVHVSADHSLIISGHHVDEVIWVSDLMQGADTEMYNEIDLWLKMVEKDWGSVYGDNDARFAAFWRTIIADNPKGTKNMKDLTYNFKGSKEVDTWLQHCRANFSLLNEIWGEKLKDRSRLGPIMNRIRRGSGMISSTAHTATNANSSASSRGYQQPNGDGVGQIPFAGNDKAAQASVTEALLLVNIDSDNEPKWPSLGSRIELSPRHFVVSKKGYFGLGSPGIQVGDSITLLAGSGCPWYLRRREEHDHFVISARAWTCGLMYLSDQYYTDWEAKLVQPVRLN